MKSKSSADRRPARHAGPCARRRDRFDLAAFPAEVSDRLVALADEACDLGQRLDEDDAEKSPANSYVLSHGRARYDAGQLRVLPMDRRGAPVRCGVKGGRHLADRVSDPACGI